MAIGIHWDDAFRLGFGPLDEQHEQLFRMIAEIDRLLDSAAPADSVVPALRRLRAALAAHFAYEDKLMRAIDDAYYDGQLAEHRLQHDSVLTDVDDIIASFGGDAADVRFPGFGMKFFDAVVRHDGAMFSALVHTGKIRLA